MLSEGSCPLTGAEPGCTGDCCFPYEIGKYYCLIIVLMNRDAHLPALCPITWFIFGTTWAGKGSVCLWEEKGPSALKNWDLCLLQGEGEPLCLYQQWLFVAF